MDGAAIGWRVGGGLCTFAVAAAGALATIEGVVGPPDKGTSSWFGPSLLAMGAVLLLGLVVLGASLVLRLLRLAGDRSGSQDDGQMSPLTDERSSKCPADAPAATPQSDRQAAIEHPRSGDAGLDGDHVQASMPSVRPTSGDVPTESDKGHTASVAQPKRPTPTTWIDLDQRRMRLNAGLRAALEASGLTLSPGMHPSLLAEEALRRDVISGAELAALQELDELAHEFQMMRPVSTERLREVGRALDLLEVTLVAKRLRRP